MKHTLFYLWTIFFMGIISSCTEEHIMQWNPENTKLTISYSTVELVTRTVPGITDLNENKVNNVTCFLYLGNNGTKEADIVKEVNIDIPDVSSPTVFTINFTEEEIRKFEGKTSLMLYVVANSPIELSNGTIAEIKKQQIVDTEFSVGNQPETFVMDGQLSMNVQLKTDGSLEYTYPEGKDILKLTRSAAKIMLHVHANNVTTEDNTTWMPQTEAMKVYFHNGVKYGCIDAGTNICLPENESMIQNNDKYYFSLKDENQAIGFNTDAKVQPEGTTVEYTQQNTPFYSYPQLWEDVLDTAPYLMLVIPWKKDTEEDENQEFVYYYYQIPISALDKRLERNHFYKIFVDVKALGSLVPTEPVTLTPSYIVVNWGGPEDIIVGLKQYRYLVAEKNEYVMNNVNEFTIPFITSHQCKLQNVQVLMDDLTSVADLSSYNDISTVAKQDPVKRDQPQGNGSYFYENTLYRNSEVTPCTNPDEDGVLTVALDNTNFTISIEHVLDNNTEISEQDAEKRKYDYRPIKITFDIVHADNEQYKESFTVIQYPMMYVEAEWNNSFGENSKTDDAVGTEYRGYVFVNENQLTTDKYNWNMVRGCYDNYKNSNHNPCMYVVTITALDKDSPYILGDPRTGQRLSDGNLYDGWNTNNAAAMYAVESGKERDLTYYNPTREDNEMIIAPKFRIASSYSKLLGDFKPKEEMRKRCATYQELGFPAGRWRLPTYAELNFIINLSVEKKIPQLFENNNGYWTATRSFVYRRTETDGYIEEWMGQNGIDKYSNSYEAGKPINRGVVRPVYDEWYWTDKCPVNQFTWGDKP